MKRPKIVSAMAMIKLRNVILEDISFLNNMIGKNQKLDDLIESLIAAKKEILELIPQNDDGIGEATSPPQRKILRSYDDDKVRSINETDFNLKFVSMIEKVESDQMEFVRDALGDKGLPHQVQTMLARALEIYIKITDQLKRSKLTNRVDTIVLP